MGLAGETQLLHLIYALGLGFWLGLYYELFRTLRLLFRPTAKSCFFQDVFFCLSSALITFFVFLAMADGEMPLYLFVGEVIGFLVFYGTFGRVFHRLLAWLLRAIGRVFRRVAHAVSRTFSRWFRRPFSYCRRKTAVAGQCFMKKIAKLGKKVIFFSKKP